MTREENVQLYNFTGLTNYKLEKAIVDGFFIKSKLEINDPEAEPTIIYYTVAPKDSIESILNDEPVVSFSDSNDWGLEIFGKKYYHKDYSKVTDNLFYPIIPALYALYLIEEKKTPGDPIIIAFNNDCLKKVEKVSFKSIRGAIKIDYIFLVKDIEYLDSSKENYKIYLKDITNLYLK